jgi:hypothetical protein
LGLLKWIGAPGSLTFLALCCGTGLLLRWAGYVRAGKVWLFAVYLSYVVGGLPPVSRFIESKLQPLPPLPNDALSAPDIDAIVVLHGDNVLGRVRETLRLADSSTAPIVVALGDESFCRMVEEAGVPAPRLRCRSGPSTTRAQLLDVQEQIRRGVFKHPVLVASRLQMPRIRGVLAVTGVAATLAPSAVDDEPGRYLPSYLALRISRDALYEHVAIWHYRRQGWIE